MVLSLLKESKLVTVISCCVNDKLINLSQGDSGNRHNSIPIRK